MGKPRISCAFWMNTFAGLAQGLGGNGAHLGALKTLDAFRKAGQAVPATLHGHVGQVAVFAQAAALSHAFLQVLHTLNVTVVVASDFEPETVGAQVDCGE